jgi:methylenetetrahydrofolate dehydrogenase (NADP+) / methenyltetrahydrofolate cyclohydrolase
MLLDGKKVADEIVLELKHKAAKNIKKPGLAIILVGDNPASITYVNAKKRRCEQIGYFSIVDKQPTTISQDKLISIVEKLNNDPNIHGILVQAPLPPHIDYNAITNTISPKKDVDGFHPINVGKMLIGQRDGFFPCTPYGILTLLNAYNIDLSSKHVVICGRSNIVGKPLAALLIQRGVDATVTIAHSYTKDIHNLTKIADVLISGIGKPDFITKDMVKKGATVIDVGINRIVKENHHCKICGDVDFENVSKIAKNITPVPGGVGPMTIAMLLKNTYKSYLAHENI